MTATRPRNATQTRADILSAARRRFATEGYERTTLRAVAADVGVDAALVIRYFGTKQDLFAAAAEFAIELPDLSNVDPDEVAGILLPRFFAVWEDETFVALLRAAMTSQIAADALRRVFAEQVAPKLITATPDNPTQRIGVMGAFVIGLATTRYVLVNPPIANLGRDELSRWAAPVIRQLLVGPAPF
ncbi:MAG TPA: TetR family transcriptional regulator [Mycobacterium sp.]|jgi:AcrR family transcriptional regulator